MPNEWGKKFFLIILILLFSHFAIANVTKSPDPSIDKPFDF